MEDKKTKFLYNIFIILFITLNILNTFIVTTQTFNRYIVPFDYNVSGVVNSIIGNLAVMLFFMAIVGLFIKNPKIKLISMFVSSFILNFALFGANIYNRYYGTSFTLKALTIFQNPSEGFGLTIAFEAFKELITYYRIILFIPTIALGFLFFKLMKRNLTTITFRTKTIKTALSKSFIIILLVFTNLIVFINKSTGIEIIDSAKPTYATQNIGIYQFTFLELLGFDYNNVYSENMNNDIYETLTKFNKNQDEYVNVIDNKTYTKNVKLKDISNISGDLVSNLNGDDYVTGILEDYNLVLIHLESFNHFLLELPEVSNHLFNMKNIMSESYVFNNFYTNVGLGNSFDAEVAIMTGLNANGTSTLAWDYNKELDDKNFNFQTIPKMFLNKGYTTHSIHGNTGEFYNRINFHPEVFGIENTYFKEDFIKDETISGTLESTEDVMDHIIEKYQHNSGMWITDRLVYDRMNEQMTANSKNNQKYMMYAITMLPHTPYHYDPYYPNPKETDLYNPEYIKKLDLQTIRYINYMKYYDEMFRVLFEDVNGYNDDYELNVNNVYKHDKTAYVFYGDHGSGISKSDLDTLYGEKQDPLESRRKLLQTTSFIYVPGENLNSNNFREGLLKGEQNLVRGQTDLFRTITDLFNLPINDNDFMFSVHGMSEEPAFSIDNRTGDLVTDYFVGSMRNEFNFIELDKLEGLDIKVLKDSIVKFKVASDMAINKNLYYKFKKRNLNL